ncbi:MAG: hypothetical protein R3E47_12005 [Paracoccaceae bacterium]
MAPVPPPSLLPAPRFAQTSLRYGHNNEPASVAGAQADWFAEALGQTSGGDIDVQVFRQASLASCRKNWPAVSPWHHRILA